MAKYRMLKDVKNPRRGFYAKKGEVVDGVEIKKKLRNGQMATFVILYKTAMRPRTATQRLSKNMENVVFRQISTDMAVGTPTPKVQTVTLASPSGSGMPRPTAGTPISPINTNPMPVAPVATPIGTPVQGSKFDGDFLNYCGETGSNVDGDYEFFDDMSFM